MYRKFVASVALCAAMLVCLFAAVQAENPEHVKQLRELKQCVGCDLNGANLEGASLEMADVRDADLRQAKLYKVNFRGANLTGAMFTGADLSGADLRDTKGADLVGAITNDMTQCPSGTAGPCQ